MKVIHFGTISAKFIVLINKIEKFRYNYQTTGIIKIPGPTYYGERFELYHFLPKEVIKDLLKQATLINQDDPFVYIESIKIKYDNTLIIKASSYADDKLTTMSKRMTEDELTTLLTYMLFDNMTAEIFKDYYYDNVFPDAEPASIEVNDSFNQTFLLYNLPIVDQSHPILLLNVVFMILINI